MSQFDKNAHPISRIAAAQAEGRVIAAQILRDYHIERAATDIAFAQDGIRSSKLAESIARLVRLAEDEDPLDLSDLDWGAPSASPTNAAPNLDDLDGVDDLQAAIQAAQGDEGDPWMAEAQKWRSGLDPERQGAMGDDSALLRGYYNHLLSASPERAEELKGDHPDQFDFPTQNQTPDGEDEDGNGVMPEPVVSPEASAIVKSNPPGKSTAELARQKAMAWIRDQHGDVSDQSVAVPKFLHYLRTKFDPEVARKIDPLVTNLDEQKQLADAYQDAITAYSNWQTAWNEKEEKRPRETLKEQRAKQRAVKQRLANHGRIILDKLAKSFAEIQGRTNGQGALEALLRRRRDELKKQFPGEGEAQIGSRLEALQPQIEAHVNRQPLSPEESSEQMRTVMRDVFSDPQAKEDIANFSLHAPEALSSYKRHLTTKYNLDASAPGIADDFEDMVAAAVGETFGGKAKTEREKPLRYQLEDQNRVPKMNGDAPAYDTFDGDLGKPDIKGIFNDKAGTDGLTNVDPDGNPYVNEGANRDQAMRFKAFLDQVDPDDLQTNASAYSDLTNGAISKEQARELSRFLYRYRGLQSKAREYKKLKTEQDSAIRNYQALQPEMEGMVKEYQGIAPRLRDKSATDEDVNRAKEIRETLQHAKRLQNSIQENQPRLTSLKGEVQKGVNEKLPVFGDSPEAHAAAEKAKDSIAMELNQLGGFNDGRGALPGNLAKSVPQADTSSIATYLMDGLGIDKPDFSQFRMVPEAADNVKRIPFPKERFERLRRLRDDKQKSLAALDGRIGDEVENRRRQFKKQIADYDRELAPMQERYDESGFDPIPDMSGRGLTFDRLLDQVPGMPNPGGFTGLTNSTVTDKIRPEAAQPRRNRSVQTVPLENGAPDERGSEDTVDDGMGAFDKGKSTQFDQFATDFNWFLMGDQDKISHYANDPVTLNGDLAGKQDIFGKDSQQATRSRQAKEIADGVQSGLVQLQELHQKLQDSQGENPAWDHKYGDAITTAYSNVMSSGVENLVKQLQESAAAFDAASKEYKPGEKGLSSVFQEIQQAKQAFYQAGGAQQGPEAVAAHKQQIDGLEAQAREIRNDNMGAESAMKQSGDAYNDAFTAIMDLATRNKKYGETLAYALNDLQQRGHAQTQNSGGFVGALNNPQNANALGEYGKKFDALIKARDEATKAAESGDPAAQQRLAEVQQQIQQTSKDARRIFMKAQATGGKKSLHSGGVPLFWSVGRMGERPPLDQIRGSLDRAFGRAVDRGNSESGFDARGISPMAMSFLFGSMGLAPEQGYSYAITRASDPLEAELKRQEGLHQVAQQLNLPYQTILDYAVRNDQGEFGNLDALAPYTMVPDKVTGEPKRIRQQITPNNLGAEAPLGDAPWMQGMDENEGWRERQLHHAVPEQMKPMLDEALSKIDDETATPIDKALRDTKLPLSWQDKLRILQDPLNAPFVLQKAIGSSIGQSAGLQEDAKELLRQIGYVSPEKLRQDAAGAGIEIQDDTMVSPEDKLVGQGQFKKITDPEEDIVGAIQNATPTADSVFDDEVDRGVHEHLDKVRGEYATSDIRSSSVDGTNRLHRHWNEGQKEKSWRVMLGGMSQWQQKNNGSLAVVPQNFKGGEKQYLDFVSDYLAFEAVNFARLKDAQVSGKTTLTTDFETGATSEVNQARLLPSIGKYIEDAMAKGKLDKDQRTHVWNRVGLTRTSNGSFATIPGKSGVLPTAEFAGKALKGLAPAFFHLDAKAIAREMGKPLKDLTDAELEQLSNTMVQKGLASKMFRSELKDPSSLLDESTKGVLDPLSQELGGNVQYDTAGDSAAAKITNAMKRLNQFKALKNAGVQFAAFTPMNIIAAAATPQEAAAAIDKHVKTIMGQIGGVQLPSRIESEVHAQFAQIQDGANELVQRLSGPDAAQTQIGAKLRTTHQDRYAPVEKTNADFAILAKAHELQQAFAVAQSPEERSQIRGQLDEVNRQLVGMHLNRRKVFTNVYNGKMDPEQRKGIAMGQLGTVRELEGGAPYLGTYGAYGGAKKGGTGEVSSEFPPHTSFVPQNPAWSRGAVPQPATAPEVAQPAAMPTAPVTPEPAMAPVPGTVPTEVAERPMGDESGFEKGAKGKSLKKLASILDSTRDFKRADKVDRLLAGLLKEVRKLGRP
jgi:hypothetical protein